MSDWDRLAGTTLEQRQSITALTDVADELARLYREVKRLEDGCQNGLVLHRCERRVGHGGKHWNDAIGAWWFDGVTTRTEREGILP